MIYNKAQKICIRITSYIQVTDYTLICTGAAASSLVAWWAAVWRAERSYCTGTMFHPKFISLAQVVPGPIQP